MDKKTTSIITVVATTLLCGLPGLIGLCMSTLAVLGAFLPDSSVPRDEVSLLVASSVTLAGLSLICLVIPIGIGFWAWWSYQKEQASIEELLIPEDDF